jgi:hypothetical protein
MERDTQLATTPGSKVSNKVIESFGWLNEGKGTEDQVIHPSYGDRL